MAFKLDFICVRPLYLFRALCLALVMVYGGATPQDKPSTKFIAGIPVYNYDRRSYLSDGDERMPQTTAALAKKIDWVLMLDKGSSDEQVRSVCVNDVGENLCVSQGHPSSGGIAFAKMRVSEEGLEQQLQRHPEVRSGEPDSEMTTYYSWGLDRIDDRFGLDNSYDAVVDGGSGVHVYVVDTGIRTSHEEFESRAIPTIEALGNGVVECDAKDTNCARDVNGHGTHCAGTIGGVNYGVAKGATLHAVKVLSDDGGGAFSWFIEALDWIATRGHRPAVVSCSLGSSEFAYSHAVEAAIDGLTAAGVVVVAAAGNSNFDACAYIPGHVGSAIIVGATEDSDKRSGFSNYGSCLDIFAPGSRIKSAFASSDTATRIYSGTSMACPHVAGAAALILQREPNLTPQQVAEHIQSHAISDAVKDRGIGSPDSLLYIGHLSPPTTPTPNPTPSPTCSSRDTGGTCYFGSCDSSRASTCVWNNWKKRCMCGATQCAIGNKCV